METSEKITGKKSSYKAREYFHLFPLFAKMSRFVKSRIFHQLLLILFTVVFLLTITQAIIIWWGFRKHIIANYELFARINVRQTAHNAKYFITSPEEKFLSIKTFFEIGRLLEIDKEAVLIQASIDNEAFQYLSLIDAQGKEIICSEPEKKLKNILSREYFKKALSGQNYRSSVIVSEDFYPVLIEALPVITLGKVTHILYGEINLKGIWHYLDSISMENPGNFFIVSDNGIVCSYKEKKFVMKNEDEKTKTLAKMSLKAFNTPLMLSLGPKEKYLLSSDKLHNLPFYLVYQLDVATILKDINKISILVLSVSVGILILGIMLIASIAKRISRPILGLVSVLPLISVKYLEKDQKMSERADEIGNLYTAFYEMNEKLLEAKARERLAVIGESAMGISHEIKNPLTAIKNYISLIISYPEDREIYQKFTAAVPQEIDRIQNMLEDLSNLSLGKKLNKKQCDIKKIIDDVVLLFEEEMNSRNIEVERKRVTVNTSLYADPEKLKSVFINLVKNAIDAFKDKGLINIEISDKYHNNNRNLSILFQDNGSGMPLHIIKNIFSPFFSTKKRGLGLGLAVSKGIVEQHQGNMEVISEGLNKGTTFLITLPVET